MPKYRVTIEEIASYTFVVDAANEDAAGDIAEEKFVNSPNFKKMECEVHQREVSNVEPMA